MVVSLMLLWFGMPLAHASNIRGMSSFGFISSLAPTPTVSTIATAKSPTDTGKGLDPAIVAALIGIGVALIAGGFVVFQTVYSARSQRRLEQEMERLRRELDEQYKAKERDEQPGITGKVSINSESINGFFANSWNPGLSRSIPWRTSTCP
ncbi:MAG TPA: hypothetical protein VN207_02280 [Ktedonobacteraceae bacterium]|nr:hypothetical protein [Ktedonobacteraceae bacterium]